MGPEREPSGVLREQLRRLREERRWTLQQLADRVRAVGGTLDRSAIAKIESNKKGKGGARKITVDEWLQLSFALGVAPAFLITPWTEDGELALTPGNEEADGVAVDVGSARAWIAGQQPVLPPSDVLNAEDAFEELAAQRREIRFYERERPASEPPFQFILTEEEEELIRRQQDVYSKHASRREIAARWKARRAKTEEEA